MPAASAYCAGLVAPCVALGSNCLAGGGGSWVLSFFQDAKDGAEIFGIESFGIEGSFKLLKLPDLQPEENVIVQMTATNKHRDDVRQTMC